MTQSIKIISLSLPLRLGNVNCFLLKLDSGFILIDTGSSNGRDALVQALENAGCQPGDLNLIVITHGDFDHIGNAAYLRQAFSTKIAMHADDLGMTQSGDMLSNRKSTHFLNRLIAFLTQRLMGFGESDGEKERFASFR